MQNEHRDFGVALLESYFDLLLDQVIGQCFEQCASMGMTTHTELDDRSIEANFRWQWARLVAKGYFEQGDVWTLSDLLQLTQSSQ